MRGFRPLLPHTLCGLRMDIFDQNIRSWNEFMLTNEVVKPRFNPLNAELNTICHFLALLGAHPILHVSRIRVNFCEVWKC